MSTFGGGLGNTGSSGLPLSGGTLTGNLVLPAAGTLSWTGRARLASSADSKMQLGDNTGATGMTLDVSASTLSIRNFADSAAGTVLCGTLNASTSLQTSTIARFNAAATDISGGQTTDASTNVGVNLRSYRTFNTVGAKLVSFQNNTTEVASVIREGDFCPTATSAMTAGTMTVSWNSLLRMAWHKFSWTNAMVTALGAVTTGDVLICTLPARTIVHRAICVITSAAGTVATLTVSAGRTGAGYIDYLTAQDAKAAANTVYGNALAEIGTNLKDSGATTPCEDFAGLSWTGTTAINAQFISTGGNLNTVTTSTGDIYLLTSVLPA